MNKFITSGVYTEGCIVPVTTEDPCIQVLHDEYEETFRINIYAGSELIDTITMNNYRNICNSVSSLPVHSYKGEYLGNVWSLIEEQLMYVYLRIHNYVAKSL